MTTDMSFTRGSPRRPVLGSIDPILIWASGLQTTDRTLHAGWISEVGKHDSFDRACHHVGFSTVKIRHGGGKTVEHWDIADSRFFVLCEGVQTLYEATSDPDCRYGIALDWSKDQNRSVLKMKVFLRALCEVGVFLPLVISVKGNFTKDIITALLAQFDLIDFVEESSRQKGNAMSYPFYAFDIDLIPGDIETRGQAGKTRDVYPITTTIPEKDTITRDFAVQHRINPEWIPEIETRLNDIIPWSISTSAAIRMGTDG